MINGTYELTVSVYNRWMPAPPHGAAVDLPAGMVGEIQHYGNEAGEVVAMVWFGGMTALVEVFADELVRID